MVKLKGIKIIHLRGENMNEEMKKKFFEQFTIQDLWSMQFACECEYGIGSELAVKLEEFLEESKDKS